jgi:hypothetical protein
MKSLHGVLLASLFLSGCATWFRAPLAAVSIPVPVPCIAEGEKPVRPHLVSELELDAMSDYQFVLALSRDRIQRIAYVGELEAAVDACARIKAP